MLLYIIVFVVLVVMTYHKFPKKIQAIGGGILFTPIIKAGELIKSWDSKVFDNDIVEVKELKKSSFKKVSSRIGRVLLITFALFFVLFEELLYNPVLGLMNKIFSSKMLQKFLKFIEEGNIILVRILLAVPFIIVQFIGIISGAFFLSGEILFGILAYLTKIVPFGLFAWINKTGKTRLMKDEWYLGLHTKVVSVIDYINSLNAAKVVKNRVMKIKNFISDSNHNTKLELKLRKKLFLKSLKEIWSLNHLSSVLSESDEIDMIVLEPKVVKKLEELVQDPDKQFLREEVLDYVISDFKKHKKA